ncbi:hypothetical protein GCM10010921_27430 [Microbacterium album]|uniref:Uncharacterized protein n=1 Tax=Microbacterium album TaxID=2053191 RepID=A0A917IIB8_9MICO|nr:hypothetical protein GCM10010921_27430 [Microbacterium album]
MSIPARASATAVALPIPESDAVTIAVWGWNVPGSVLMPAFHPFGAGARNRLDIAWPGAMALCPAKDARRIIRDTHTRSHCEHASEEAG